MATQEVTLQNIIKEGDHVVLKKNTTSKVFEVSKTKSVYFMKQLLKLEPLIGKPYGSLFQSTGKKLELVEVSPQKQYDASPSVECAADNRFLMDDGKSQKLTKDEIEELKSKDVKGAAIIQEIIRNSTSFKEKTVFSQAKYVKKKTSKYAAIIEVLRPNCRLITEMYYQNGPTKICNLRIDTLGQMLNTANICGGNYLVVDDCLGLLVAGVLERMGLEGRLIQVYLGDGPTSSARQAVEWLNISPEHIEKHLHGITFAKAINALMSNDIKMKDSPQLITAIVEHDSDLELESPKKFKSDSNNEVEKMDQSECSDIAKKGKCSDIIQKREKFDRQKERRTINRAIREKETVKALELLQSQNLDSLLIACKHHPTSVVLPLIEFLAPSRPFAIFCMYQSPLADCYQKLKESGSAILLQLTETWLRKYQVMDERTRPENNMSGTGGFLLTGIRVLPVPEALMKTN